MIIYNVTIKVENESAAEWVEWMNKEHMPEVMSLGIFNECRLCRLLELDDTDGETYAAQYVCNSIDDYNTYINEHALVMRDKSMQRFGGKFVAFRSVMEIIS